MYVFQGLSRLICSIDIVTLFLKNMKSRNKNVLALLTLFCHDVVGYSVVTNRSVRLKSRLHLFSTANLIKAGPYNPSIVSREE